MSTSSKALCYAGLSFSLSIVSSLLRSIGSGNPIAAPGLRTSTGKMSSPTRPWLSHEDSFHSSPLHTRTSTLTTLIRTRSQQSLSSPRQSPPVPRHLVEDEETGPIRALRLRNEDDATIERLLRDERRLSQILHGPQARSLRLIGRSNPRYRWEQYWKTEQELGTMRKPM